MGYFSNGTEGEMYQEKWCDRCLHRGDDSCAVWLVHLTHNYDQHKDKILKLALDTLIPREGIGNGQCRMFLDEANNGSR